MIDLPAGKLAVLAPTILIASKSLIAWAWGRGGGEGKPFAIIRRELRLRIPRDDRAKASQVQPVFCAFREMRFYETDPRRAV